MSANRANIYWHLENQIPSEDRRAIGMVYEKMVDVSAAEIIFLKDVPKELVAAPGAGKVLEFISAVIFLDYGTTVYTGGGNLTILYNSGSAVSDLVANSELINENEDTYENIGALAGAANQSLDVNTALELTVANADHAAGGGGTLKVAISYRIHDFNEKHPRFDN